jgi:hypothetical protein
VESGAPVVGKLETSVSLYSKPRVVLFCLKTHTNSEVKLLMISSIPQ